MVIIIAETQSTHHMIDKLVIRKSRKDGNDNRWCTCDTHQTLYQTVPQP